MGTATCQLGYLMDWQLCEWRTRSRPTMLLLELHFKVSGEKRKEATNTGRNNAVLAFCKWLLISRPYWHHFCCCCKLAATLQSFRWKKKVAHSGRNNAVLAFCKWLLISRPSWHHFCCCCKLAATLQSFRWKKKLHTLTETTLFWHYMTAHLSPILIWKSGRLADFCKLWNHCTCMHICWKQSRSSFQR